METISEGDGQNRDRVESSTQERMRVDLEQRAVETGQRTKTQDIAVDAIAAQAEIRNPKPDPNLTIGKANELMLAKLRGDRQKAKQDIERMISLGKKSREGTLEPSDIYPKPITPPRRFEGMLNLAERLGIYKRNLEKIESK